MTYNINDILLMFGHTGEIGPITENVTTLMQNKSTLAWIETYNTTSGSCFTIRLKNPFTNDDKRPYFIEFDLKGKISDLTLFFHNPKTIRLVFLQKAFLDTKNRLVFALFSFFSLLGWQLILC